MSGFEGLCPAVNRRRDSWADGAGCYEFRTKFFLLYERREDGVSCWHGFVWAQGPTVEFGDPVFILDRLSLDLLISDLLIFDLCVLFPPGMRLRNETRIGMGNGGGRGDCGGRRNLFATGGQASRKPSNGTSDGKERGAVETPERARNRSAPIRYRCCNISSYTTTLRLRMFATNRRGSPLRAPSRTLNFNPAL